MARKFKFKLASVLRYREMLEDERKREFAEANREVEERRAQAEHLAEERQGMMDEVRDMTSGGEINVDLLVATLRTVGGIEMGIMNAEQDIIRLKQAAEGKRQAFVEARRDKRALEILKEKKEDEARQEWDREFQQDLDELSLRSMRKREKEKQREAAYSKEGQ